MNTFRVFVVSALVAISLPAVAADLPAQTYPELNAEVGVIHPKAMPVILRTAEEIEAWMTKPADQALKLQRPLPDGSLRIVARGIKEDGEVA